MRAFVIFLLGAFPALAYAQHFHAEGGLEQPQTDGFYKIALTPASAPFMAPEFNNVRILDGRKKEVPYIFTEEKAIYRQQQFKEYVVLEKKQVNRAYTSIKLQNPGQLPINNISLLIKNAEVSKSARLSGSDDGKNWFAVKENFTLSYINNPDAVHELRAIEFPLTNYTYYLLEISDSASTPINILKAGYYDASATTGLYSQIVDSFTITTETKEKQTYIRLKFAKPQFIDKLELAMKGAPFFQREGVLFTTEYKKVKKRFEEYDRVLQHLVIRSGQTTISTFGPIKTDNLTIRIENGDNPTLTINELSVYQLNRYLTAWLSEADSYTVAFGGSELPNPKYDLTYFRDSIPANAQVLLIGKIDLIESNARAGKPLWNNALVAWIAIGSVIILLGIMSINMVRETSARKEQS